MRSAVRRAVQRKKVLSKNPDEITVSRLIVRYLERLGAEFIFGIPGAHILPVYDAIFDSAGIKPILSKHEQGASFMAGGYARQTGKVGVCVATAGPGATNLVTGIANAYMDRLPVLAITGETPTYSFGKGALQESSGEGASINQIDIFRGITRYNGIVQRTDYILNVLRNITGILLSQNPGPVLVSFPYNILRESVDGNLLDEISFRPRHTKDLDAPVQADEIASLISSASFPVIIAGSGCVLSGAEDVIARFCRKNGIPLATTLKARGIIPESSAGSLGVLGITSNELAFRYITEKADLIIMAGASFGERTSYNWANRLLHGKKIIQIDNDELRLNKVFIADIALKADVRQVFERLIENSGADRADAETYPAVAEFKSKYSGSGTSTNEFRLVSRMLRALNNHFKGNVSIFDDNIIYMQRFCCVSKSGSYFPNSGISSLGHAVPAAIGARLGTDKPVIALLGDGGFQMCCMELMTAVNYSIPVTVILLNNSTLGLVRKNQFYNYAGRFISSDFINPDYLKLAESFSINYFRVESETDMEKLLASIDFDNVINLVELVLDKDEFPQYASGR